MKKILMIGIFAATVLSGFSSCKNCKKCHSEVMGVKSAETELCGDELKQAQQTPTMVCE